MWKKKIDTYYPTRQKGCSTGWFSPTGEFISCGMGQHEIIGAILVCLGAPKNLKGWLRMSDNWTGDQLNGERLSSSQARIIQKRFPERLSRIVRNREHIFTAEDIREAKRNIEWEDEFLSTKDSK